MVSFTVTWPKITAATSPATGSTAQPPHERERRHPRRQHERHRQEHAAQVMRSISRPTVNCVSAPHRVTTNAATPIAGSRRGSDASRSCSSFGISSVKALNTRPETTAISSNTTTARRTTARGMGGNGRAARAAA